jgi:flagellar motility protein MotE (MotC chaperone)
MRVKLIPVVIVLAALGISFRAGSVWDSLSDDASQDDPRVAAGAAVAQDDGAPVVQQDPDAPPEPLQLDESDVPIIDGTSDMHPVEQRLANSLAQRRVALDQRERELEEREAMLGVVEDRIDAKQNELEGIRQEIERLVARYDAEQDEESARLQRVYSNMKPKRAAAIFDSMELDTILTVIRGMSDRKLAPILESMAPDKAVLVTQELERREELPAFQ